MPFADASIDICLSSNVGEHVPDPWALAEEMLRVTKDDGLLIYSYTVWLSPFGGHETGHVALPRRRARGTSLRTTDGQGAEEPLRRDPLPGICRRPG